LPRTSARRIAGFPAEMEFVDGSEQPAYFRKVYVTEITVFVVSIG
jgi:hypothetical protein